MNAITQIDEETLLIVAQARSAERKELREKHRPTGKSKSSQYRAKRAELLDAHDGRILIHNESGSQDGTDSNSSMTLVVWDFMTVASTGNPTVAIYQEHLCLRHQEPDITDICGFEIDVYNQLNTYCKTNGIKNVMELIPVEKFIQAYNTLNGMDDVTNKLILIAGDTHIFEICVFRRS